MSTTNPTGRHTIEASPTTVHLAEPGTAAPPKAGKRHRLKRMITGLALAAAAAAIPLTTGVTAASADELSAITYPLYNVYIQSASSGMLLDVQYGSQAPGAHVIQWPLDYGANQLWDFQPNYGAPESSFGYVINANSDQCLSTDGVPGDPVFQSTCEGASWQRWGFLSRDGGQTYQILSQYFWDTTSSAYNLDVYQASDSPGAVIDLWPSTISSPTGGNQLFNLLPGPPS